MKDTYRHTWDAVLRARAAGIAWPDLMYVLDDSRPCERRFLDSVLWITAPDPHGRWMVVRLLETANDEYEVVTARYADADEVARLEQLLGGA